MREGLCRWHSAKLVMVAFGSLLDFSGRLYRRWSKEILAQSKTCPKCYPIRNERQP